MDIADIVGPNTKTGVDPLIHTSQLRCSTKELEVTTIVGINAATQYLCDDENKQQRVFLYLACRSAPTLQDGIQKLLEAAVSTSCRLTDFHLDVSWLTQSTLVPLTITLSKLPNLVHASLDYTDGRVSDHDENMSVGLLTPLLVGSRQLKMICSRDISFRGTEEDFCLLAEAMKGHPELRCLHFADCRVLVGDSDQSPAVASSIAKVLGAISTLPNLMELELSGWLTSLKKGPSRSKDITTIGKHMQAIGSHPKLQSLTLPEGLRLSKIYNKTVAAVESSNSILHLSLKADKSASQLLTNLLTKNTSIHRLHFGVVSGGSDSYLAPILASLKDNKTISKLGLSRLDKRKSVPSKEVQDTLVSILETENHTLNEITFYSWKNTNWQMKIYLVLNRLGCKNLLNNPNAKKLEWVQALILGSKDLNVLFYLLSFNPAICGQNIATNHGPLAAVPMRPSKRARLAPQLY